MARRRFSYTILALLLAAGTACANEDPVDPARALHPKILTLDTHIDIPSVFATPAADPGVDGPMQVDLPKMIAGGLDAGFFIVFVGQGPLTPEGYAMAHQAAMTKFAAIDRMTALYGDAIGLARTPTEARALKAAGKRAAMIGLENGYSLGPALEHMEDYFARGARYMGITHIGNNALGDSSMPRGNLGTPDNPHDEPVHNGLSALGRQAIAEMNRLGIMVDVSHASKATTLQAVAHSRAPVIASHSALRALYDIPRNLSDEEMRAIAAKGGVVQVVAFDTYLIETTPEKMAARRAAMVELGLTSREAFTSASQHTIAELRRAYAALGNQFPRASIADLVDHIDHAVEIMGVDHVGIASDFGGGGGVEGWDDASTTHAVTAELLRRGYNAEEIAKIWGENLLRVWEVVAAIAREQD